MAAQAISSKISISEASQDVVKEGWLIRKGHFLRCCRRTYSILMSNGFFMSFKSKPTDKSVYKYDDCFNIKGCEIISTNKPKPYTFIIRRQSTENSIERTYSVDTYNLVQEWIQSIEMLLNDLSHNNESTPDFSGDVSKRVAKKRITINDFAFLRVIGKGGFGKVLLCKEKETENLYAMKVVKKELIFKKNETCHILAEAKVLRTLHHPFLMSLKYSFQTDCIICFVMEFANGGDIFFHLTKDGPFTENRAKFYGAETVSAISYLHSQEIIYRDLKTENMLLDREGHIKLTDFGLCKESMMHDVTTSSFCGTPEYMAPEVIQRLEYDRCVDWWGVGVVIYEMLSGRLPFYSKDYDILVELITMKSVEFPSYISEEGHSLLRSLLRKNPKRRLGSGSNGCEMVKQHNFFNSINWSDLELKKVEVPFLPEVTYGEDAKYFDDTYASLNVDITPCDSPANLETSENDRLLEFNFNDCSLSVDSSK